MWRNARMRAAAAACMIAAIAAHPARAQTPAEFFAGKTVTLICSAAAGGAVDLNARQVAKHIARFIPGNPTVVVRNMPGGGHLLATNFLYNQAPKDGTHIGTFINMMPLHQVTGGQGVHFDTAKFNWLGSTGVSNLTIMVWHTAGVKTIEDVKKREVLLGATGVGSGSYLYGYALNQILGTRFKMVTGYKGIADIDLATERGEVQGRSGASLSGLLKEHPEWLKSGKMFPLVQIGTQRDKLYPDVPLLQELEATPEQREILKVIASPVMIGRPYVAPPGVPADRVEALRKAFWTAMQDAEFHKEAAALSLELNPVDGPTLAKIVQDTLNTPADLLAKVKPLLAPEGSGQKKK
jgi:tripartite-type tricarboxylate transporter receptor subunit TctC